MMRDEGNPCTVLFVSDANLLDDAPESLAQRQVLGALAGPGMASEAVCRFVAPGDQEIEPAGWLAERGWPVAPTPQAAPTSGRAFRVRANGVPVMLFHGASSKPHVPNDAERAGFLRLLESRLEECRPTVVVARSGPCVADVLSKARAREIATAALQPDCTPRDGSAFRDADVVITPTRFAAEYLREALGLPCANLPPLVAQEEVPESSPAPGSVVFDYTLRGGGLGVFVQIAEELTKRRPDNRLVLLGGAGVVTLASGAKVECVPNQNLGRVWTAAGVYLAPMLNWEAMPWTALSALRHGVPVIASDRGPLPELLGDLATVLPLPDRLTPAVPMRLRDKELSAWVDAIVRVLEDREFATAQGRRALEGSARWDPEKLAPQYASFLSALAERRHEKSGNRAPKPSQNGFTQHLGQLAEKHPWPEQRPADAAPGQQQGWLGAGTDEMLGQTLSADTRLVVELGAWLGLSTRFIAAHAPNAVVISVDHWQGSPEHQGDATYRNLLPRLVETFQSRCWEQRKRIVPLRMTTVEGLQAVAKNGLQPDFVYVDAEHSYNAVSAELALARQLFPRAALGGDDYDWQGVREAVTQFARQQGMIVDRVGWRGWRLLEGWQAADATHPPPARTQTAVLVPHMNGIEAECDQALQQLERAGVRVVRRGGCSAIDVARNEMISDALHDGVDAMLFIDSDIGFEPADALRLLARPEPVVSGVYAKKGVRALASEFAPGVKEVLFGPEAAGPYPLRYAATGFLRIRAEVLRRMIEQLKLPLCNTQWGRGLTYPQFVSRP